MAYVYRHIRVDKNEPFYIGIGKTEYRYRARQGRNPIWKRIVSKTDFYIEIIFKDVSWEFACQKEIEFIKLYGRIDRSTGILANMTDGGDGNLGLKHSDQAIERISKSSKGRQGYWKGKSMSDEFKAKISLSKLGNTNTKGRTISESHKDAVRKHATGNRYCVGRVLSDDTKKKIGDANRGRKVKEPWKCALLGARNGMYGKRHTEKSIRANKEAQKRKPVVKKSKGGVIIQEYSSIADAAFENRINASGISAACRGAKGFPSYKGFVWEYKREATL